MNPQPAAVGYVRVSTEKQVTESQVAEIEAFCARKGLDLSVYGVLRESEVVEVVDDATHVANAGRRFK